MIRLILIKVIIISMAYSESEPSSDYLRGAVIIAEKNVAIVRHEGHGLSPESQDKISLRLLGYNLGIMSAYMGMNPEAKGNERRQDLVLSVRQNIYIPHKGYFDDYVEKMSTVLDRDRDKVKDDAGREIWLENSIVVNGLKFMMGDPDRIEQAP